MTEVITERSKAHKAAIKREMQRREDVENERIRLEEEAKKAKERRQERRKCLKEQKRIYEIQNMVLNEFIVNSEQREFAVTTTPIYDVREYNLENPSGLYTYGGFVGELIFTLFNIQQNLISKPENVGFMFEADQIETLIKELMNDGFTPGTCYVKVMEEPEGLIEGATMLKEKASTLARKLVDPAAHAQFGMKFLLNQSENISMNSEVVEEVFKAICKMHFEEQKELVPEPDEEGEHADEAREQAQASNEEINKFNEAIAKVQSFVKLIPPMEDEPPVLDYESFGEKCFVRLMNYREPPEPADGLAPSQ